MVHHCHYSCKIFGLTHKRCNSVISQDAKFKKLNIYAHNAAFDLNYVVKGINYSLMAQEQTKFPETSVLGEDEGNLKRLIIGPCCYQDTFKVFGVSLDALCRVKTHEEKGNVEAILFVKACIFQNCFKRY